MKEKRKTPIFKKKWFWIVIAVLFVIGAIGNIVNGDDSDVAEDPGASQKESAPPSQTVEVPSEDPTSEVYDAPEVSDTSDSPSNTPSESATSIDTLCVLIEATLSENYSGCEITHDDNSITVNVWLDGLTAELTTAQIVGGDDYMESWNTAKANTVELAGSICSFIDAMGREDVYLTFNVLNDLNHENVLLSILENVVLYDVMAQ